MTTRVENVQQLSLFLLKSEQNFQWAIKSVVKGGLIAVLLGIIYAGRSRITGGKV